LKQLENLLPGRLVGYGLFGLSVLLGAPNNAFGQTIYYVAAYGNDTNSGRTEAKPFQTMARVSSLGLQPGDAVVFKRGDTFRGALTVRQSGTSERPIRIGAYDTGEPPILAGSVVVSGWANIGGNVWQATCAECGPALTGLYRSGQPLPLGRYPNLSDANKGYLTVQAHVANSQLTSQQPLPTNFTGGEVVYRPVQWILNRAAITSQNANTLNINNNSSYHLTDGWGFFIQNHPATLDQNGEWYYDPANKTIRLYDSQTNPNEQTITAPTADVINLTNASNVTVDMLHITESLGAGITNSGGSGLTIYHNRISNSGTDAIRLNGSGSGIVIDENQITEAHNNGIGLGNYQNVTIQRNTLRGIGAVAGRGQSGDGTYTALLSQCRQNGLIQHNIVDNVGYVGISVVSNTTVRNNVISNFCTVKSDGGGIYSWNGNKDNPGGLTIQNNLIFNGIGAAEGSSAGEYSGANGIFLDDCSQNSQITGNSVFNSAGIGIFLQSTSNLTVTNNTVVNNGAQQFRLNYNGICPPRNNTIQQNIFLSKWPQQRVADYESQVNDLGSYGAIDNNVYARPFDDAFKIRMVYNPGSGLVGSDNTLEQWRAAFGKDANSTNSPLTYRLQTAGQVVATLLNQPFNADHQGWGVWSPQGNGRAEWDNSNRLDGGTLRLGFASASGQANSYLIATAGIGAVGRGKTYHLMFDGLATAGSKRVQVFLRQQSGSYSDVSARTTLAFSTNRQRYEATFTATADEANAILVMQVQEDGQTAWVDNLQFREAALVTNNPDDLIKFYYNTTGQPITQPLDGAYRDARNVPHSGQVSIPAYSSVVLLRDNGQATPAPTPAPPVPLRAPDNPANATPGLDVQYYEGSWSSVPNFDNLTPAKITTANVPDHAPRNRDSNYGLRFRGYVRVPTDGVYTFYTASDDGSQLYIGSTLVVNNDGFHPIEEKTGTIGLKAGLHAITVPFFQGGGGQGLSVSYAGPGIGKQVVPASAFFRVAVPTAGANNGTGLRGQYFNNMTLTAPSVLTRTDPTINFDWGYAAPGAGLNADYYSARWTGEVEAPASGQYTFTTRTDDGVRLWVNGVQLVNDWNGHAPTNNSGTITLEAGRRYAIKMEYFEHYNGAVAQLFWTYPGQIQHIVPQGRLYPAVAGGRTAADIEAEISTDQHLRAYPIPAHEQLTIEYLATAPGTVQIQLVNLVGQPVLTQPQPVSAGQNEFHLNVASLSAGTYVLVLTQDGKQVSRQVVKW
jgi:parallel beta-helix repeat protein